MDDGKPVGILVAPYALDIMSRALVETKLENGWTISLIDQHGYLSARPNIEAYSPPVDLNGYEPVKQMRTGPAGYGIFARDGKTVAAPYEPVTQDGWGGLVRTPDSLFQPGVAA